VGYHLSEKDKSFGVEKRGHLISAPRARAYVKRGFDTVGSALGPTLGPVSGTVIVEPMLRTDPPEILDDAARIAQRIVELPLPLNAGGMLMRHLVYRVLDRVGDGTATAAVIAQSLLGEATRYVASGANPANLRRGIETGLDQALAALAPQGRGVEPAQARGIAVSAGADSAVADKIGEILITRGPDVVIVVQEWLANELVVEEADGAKWSPGFASAEFITDRERNLAWSEKPWVLLTNLDLDRAEQVLPIMQQFASTGERELVIIGGKITESALATLLVNNQRGVLHTIGIQAPEGAEHRLGVLRDLAARTSARVIDGTAGEKLEYARLSDLGSCDMVWASRDFFAVIGGDSDDEAVERRIAGIRARLETEEVPFERENLRKRLGYLTAGVVTLCVGAATKTEMVQRKLRAERAVKAVWAAGRDGVVPGGGVALVNCAAAIVTDDPDLSLDERLGRLALVRALEEPFRVIARNAGVEPGLWLDAVRGGDGWTGLNARGPDLVDLYQNGIVDPMNVVRVAMCAGVSGAVMALLTEAIVIPKFRLLHVDPTP
jgi:chaperonin GroEL